jgi:serine/threonine protein kinase
MSESIVLATDTRIRERYRVLRQIGGGAMARVYLAEDSRTDDLRAIKVQQVGGSSANGRSETLLEIAQREIDFLTTLSHPSLPRINDYFREGDCIYLVMDFVEGHNLKTLVEANRGTALDVATVVHWGIQLCDVLDYLHCQHPPIIFRDVKPSNIIRRPDNSISLVDFGIARQLREGASSDTMVFGSPGYAPPEQYGHDQTEPRSDLYALGATLHHLLTGRDPSLTPFKWPAVRTLNPKVPLVLERLVMRCLEIDPTRRPESAEAMGKSLRSIQEMLERSGTRDLTLPTALNDPLAGMGVPSSRLASQDLEIAPKNGTQELPRPPVFLSHEALVLDSEAGTGNGTGSVRLGTAELRARAASALSRPFPLFRALTIGAVLVMLLCLFYPLLHSQLKPEPAPITMPSINVVGNGALTSEAVQQAYQQSQAQATHRAEVYENIKYMSYVLDGLVLLAFLGGVIQPKRATRPGMVLTIGGVLGLICLTALTFLPERKELFIAVALVECLLLIPATILLASPETFPAEANG